MFGITKNADLDRTTFGSLEKDWAFQVAGYKKSNGQFERFGRKMLQGETLTMSVDRTLGVISARIEDEDFGEMYTQPEITFGELFVGIFVFKGDEIEVF